MITRRPLRGAVSKYFAATKIPSLIFVAPPTWNALICSASIFLSLVNGTRNSASVENVKSATSSSGFSAASAVLAASRSGPRNGPIESLKSSTSETFKGNSSRLKISHFCAAPSSRSSKSSFFKSPRICPALVFIVASTITRFTATRITGGSCSCARTFGGYETNKNATKNETRIKFVTTFWQGGRILDYGAISLSQAIAVIFVLSCDRDVPPFLARISPVSCYVVTRRLSSTRIPHYIGQSSRLPERRASSSNGPFEHCAGCLSPPDTQQQDCTVPLCRLTQPLSYIS